MARNLVIGYSPAILDAERFGLHPAVDKLWKHDGLLRHWKVEGEPHERVVDGRCLVLAQQAQLWRDGSPMFAQPKLNLHSDTYLVTSQACRAAHVLALEEIDDEAVVALLVHYPLLVRGDLRRERLKRLLPLRRHLDMGLDLDLVQVFVQPVKHEREELL